MKSRRSHYDLSSALCHWCRQPTHSASGLGPLRTLLPDTLLGVQVCSTRCGTDAFNAHRLRSCPSCDTWGWA